jgi:hypothetical protein
MRRIGVFDGESARDQGWFNERGASLPLIQPRTGQVIEQVAQMFGRMDRLPWLL